MKYNALKDGCKLVLTGKLCKEISSTTLCDTRVIFCGSTVRWFHWYCLTEPLVNIRWLCGAWIFHCKPTTSKYDYQFNTVMLVQLFTWQVCAMLQRDSWRLSWRPKSRKVYPEWPSFKMLLQNSTQKLWISLIKMGPEIWTSTCVHVVLPFSGIWPFLWPQDWPIFKTALIISVLQTLSKL